MDTTSLAILELGRALRRERYAFITVTPETQRRVNARALRLGLGRAQSLRDAFGWNRPFSPELLPRSMLELLQGADLVTVEGDLMRSRVRFATLEGQLFAHSAYPTTQAESVFFGPDTYRFCALLERWAPARAKHLVDVGSGSGAGGISLAKRAQRVVLADVSPRAGMFARVNAALASVSVEIVESDVLQSVTGQPDLIVANPPYMRDPQARVYRDGGGTHGEELSVRIVRESLARLASGGALILYTGTAIIGGVDVFMRSLSPILEPYRERLRAPHFAYQELDPDVFGEELDQPAYAEVDRIAAVGLHITVA